MTYWKTADIPQAERKCTERIFSLLDELDWYLESLKKDISLYQFCKCNSEAVAWKDIAARDAVMNLFHFFNIMKGIRSSFKDAIWLRSLVDHAELKAAVKLFNEKFPDYEEFRHAIAHLGESSVAMESHLAAEGVVNGVNLFSGGRKFYVTNSFVNDSYFCTTNGRTVSLEISPATVSALSQVYSQFKQGFRPVEAK